MLYFMVQLTQTAARVRARQTWDEVALKLGFGLHPISKCLDTSDPRFKSLAKLSQLTGEKLVDDRERILFEGISLLSENGDKAPWAGNVKGAFEDLVFRERPVLAAGIRTKMTLPLPDPNDVFDRLLSVQTDYRRTRCTKNASSMIYTVALLLSLCIEHVKSDDKGPAGSSFNLAPLYGSGPQAQSTRCMDGSGMLRRDTFAEEHTALYPSSFFALLVLFNRNHNAIALGLRIRNPGRWQDPTGERRNQLTEQDQELFELARIINCLTFRNLVAQDLLKGVLGLHSADPNVDLGDLDNPRVVAGSPAVSIPLYNWSSLISNADEAAYSLALSAHHGALLSYEDVLAALKQTGDGNPYLPTDSTEDYQRDKLVRKEGVFGDSELFDVLRAAIEEPAGKGGAQQHPDSFKPLEIRKIERFRAGIGRALTLNDYRKYLGLKALKSFEEWNPDASVAKAAEDLYTNIDNLESYAGLLAEAGVRSPNGAGLGLGYTMTFALIVDLCARIRGDVLTLSRNSATLTEFGLKESSIDRHNGAYGSVLPKLLCRHLPQHFPPRNIWSLFPFSVPEHTKGVLSKRPQSHLDEPPVFYETEAPAQRNIVVPKSTDQISLILNVPDAFPTPYLPALKDLTSHYGYMLGFDELDDSPEEEEEKYNHDTDLIMAVVALLPDRSIAFEYASHFRDLIQDTILSTQFKKENRSSKLIKIDIIKDLINPVCTRWVCDTLCDYTSQASGGDPQASLLTPGELSEVKARHKTQDVASVTSLLHTIYAYIMRDFEPEHSLSLRKEAIDASNILRTAIYDKIPFPAWFYKDHFWGRAALDSGMSRIKWLQTVILKQLRGTGDDAGALPPQTFLERVEQALITTDNPRLRNSIAKYFQDVCNIEDFSDLQTLIAGRLSDIAVDDQRKLDIDQLRFQRKRIVANVLGLSAITAVSLAEAISVVVDFYLDPEREADRRDLIAACRSESNLGAMNDRIIGYFNDALRLRHHSGVWRKSKITFPTAPLEYADGFAVNEGDDIYIDFSEFHVEAHRAGTPGAAELDCPLVGRPNMEQGYFVRGSGFHKCPGTYFLNMVVPDIMRGIFTLKNLNLVEGHRLIRVPNPAPFAPPQYLSLPKGDGSSEREVSRFPKNLLVTYEPSVIADPPEKRFAALYGNGKGRSVKPENEKWERRYKLWTRLVRVSVILCFLLYGLWYTSLIVKRTSDADIKVVNVDCPQPVVVWNTWEAANITTDSSDPTPRPFTYTANRDVPHQLWVYDIDRRDMRLSISVDGVVRGLTRDFELDLNIDCGDNMACVQENQFSAGGTIVPAGSHTVSIAWEGKEFANNSGTLGPGLGFGAVRRFMWTRVDCGRAGRDI